MEESVDSGHVSHVAFCPVEGSRYFSVLTLLSGMVVMLHEKKSECQI